MKHTWFTVLLITLFSHGLRADEIGNNIDSSLRQCKISAISTIDSQTCYNTALKEWDAELGKQYQLLMNGQSDNVRIALRDSQRQWIKYRDQYLSAIDVFYQQQDGTISSLNSAESKINITRDKAIDLFRLRNSTDLSSIVTTDKNKKQDSDIIVNADIQHVSETNVSPETSTDTSVVKSLVCKFVMQGDKSVKETPGFFAENKMTILDKGTQFIVLTGDYFNIPEKLASPENLTLVNNKWIGTGSRQDDGAISTFSKDSSNYVVTKWANSSFKHTKFQLVLYACK